MFNETQRGLLIEARELISRGRDRFICCAINAACQAISENPYDMKWSESHELKEQIESGISGYAALELWLFSKVGVYPDDLVEYARDCWERHAFAGWSRAVTRKQFDDLCRQARLAWIDRALETGRLA
jgi:hypothetical protein